MTLAFGDQLLEDFVGRFYGYGNYNGDYWFIGMEEGGGNSFEDVESRLHTWSKRGRRELEDVAEYHIEMGVTRLFSEHPKLQRTWSKLIRILLSARGELPTVNQVRQYQRGCLGRLGGNTCLLELLPLPSPSTGHWLYAQYSKLSYLADRETYKQKCLAFRIAHLKQRIRVYKPSAVIFYSFTYREYWQGIAGIDFSLVDIEQESLYIARGESTVFIIVKHPATTGLTNEYFHQVGKLLMAVNKR